MASKMEFYIALQFRILFLISSFCGGQGHLGSLPDAPYLQSKSFMEE